MPLGTIQLSSGNQLGHCIHNGGLFSSNEAELHFSLLHLAVLVLGGYLKVAPFIVT
ncbi:protein of unknown function [Shewanella benthica]|uniref:Uncharacterized protein n=1 Tax=Shewanella benthica TaxID=43661 RepID=A0A330LZD8_9GAMM|nr:protein of unknown function [Shewanella benthica]